MVKVFSMNDDEWWIGETLESCIDDYVEFYGGSDGLDEPQELSQSELEQLTYCDDENQTTFLAQLAIEIERGGEFPRMFACTEM